MSKFGKIYLVISSIIILILFIYFIFFGDIPSGVAIAFLGVLVGSIISGVVQFVISDTNIKQQLRLAVLDKRFQAHQEAYTLWQGLLFIDRQKKESTQFILNCQEWWNKNCLYLSADARSAFKKAYIAADYLSQPVEVQAGLDARKKDMEDLKRAGEIILNGVNLPSIGEEESKRVDKHSKRGI